MIDVLLSPIRLSELELLIENSVKNALATKQPQAAIEIIDRDELCKRLSITEPTAIRWEKKGRIPSLRIGSNVRYNWPAVIESLEKRA